MDEELRLADALVPELDVSSLDQTLAFYCGVLGFAVAFDRPEDRFACLRREDACLMVEEAAGPGRRFRTAPLEHPFGRGINLQIRVADVEALNDTLIRAGHIPVIGLEERWYRTGQVQSGNRQLVVEDPDGYLLRFYQDLGRR